MRFKPKQRPTSFVTSYESRLSSTMPIRRRYLNDLTPMFGTHRVLDENGIIYYDDNDEVFRVKTSVKDYTAFSIVLTLSGKFNNTGNSVVQIKLTRPDGTTVGESEYVQILNTNLTFEKKLFGTPLPTAVRAGGQDLFQTEGFKIQLYIHDGTDVTLAASEQEIRFEGNH